jgi:anti-sigma-K factor RskA
MSELTNMPAGDQALALEYVLGTLRGSERRAFVKALATDPQLQQIVANWEETLMALPGPSPVSAPALTWAKIEAALDSGHIPSHKLNVWRRYGSWATGIAAACLLSLGVWFARDTQPAPAAWKASYVAVLTDATGQAQLTAFTQSQGEPPNAKHQLRLQAQSATVARQVWAVSVKDGSLHKLAELDAASSEPAVLTKEQWIIIKEAKELVLTEKAVNDAVPGKVLAKGPCVQLTQQAVPKPAATI